MSTYEPIASQTLGSTASSVIFSSLPQNYTDLIIVSNAKGSENTAMLFQFNGDTTTNYSQTRMYGDGSSPASDRQSNTTAADAGDINTEWGTYIAQIQNYANATTSKTLLNRCNISSYVFSSVSLWRKTPEPITSVRIICRDGSFQIGSIFTVYGVTAGNSSAKASGGNIVTTDGSYWYHTFTTSGAFIPSEPLTVDYLVVAGGGGGGSRHAGGGGAGGYRTSIGGSALSLSANTFYQTLVGAGGIGASNNLSFTNNGTAGINSVFSTITATGGGKGGGNNDVATNGGAGGSGGGGQYGGSGGSGAGGTEGNNGGSGSASASSYGGGGGGGAGGPGSNGSSSAGGAGGNGTANSILGTSITYAGGGGGGVFGSGSAGTGGTGGGGAGSANGNKGTAGTVNLGGGGGGGGSDSSPNAGGGNGGSGIIILRYAV
jgi:hypothetical protein